MIDEISLAVYLGRYSKWKKKRCEKFHTRGGGGLEVQNGSILHTFFKMCIKRCDFPHINRLFKLNCHNSRVIDKGYSIRFYIIALSINLF